MNEICKKVVIIDDDSHNNHILKIVLRHICKPLALQVSDFTLPAEGVGFLADFLVGDSEPVVLFLDINMPVLMGWDVLDRLSLLPDYAKDKLTVYMLSSSVDPADIQRAEANALVRKFVPKPITTGMNWVKEAITETTAV